MKQECVVGDAGPFGFSEGVLADISSMLESVGIRNMTPEEQAVFLLEFSRLIQDRFQQRSSSAQVSYETFVRMVCKEFSSTR